MKVTLLGHTQLAEDTFNLMFKKTHTAWDGELDSSDYTDGQVIALAAIRQCYSHKTALEVLDTESEKYFGEQGKEGKRLFNHIVKSGHTSTLEHIHFTFAVEGVSRALLAQLTRHRQLSFSVQSQRYNKFSSDSRSGGFDYVVPEKIKEDLQACGTFHDFMVVIQQMYDSLIRNGVPQEDARAILPNAASCNLVTSGNLRAWLEFYKKRKKGEGAQHEITEFAEAIKNAIIEVEPWTSDYFNCKTI
ncbi:MAG: FAD-dependent thymidylate synthase [Lysinibacillus sp.]